MGIAVDTVLVPVDGSEESVEAAEYAVAIADRYDAAVHALYVLGEGQARGMAAGDLDAGEVADDSGTFLGEVRELGDAEDVRVTASTVFGFSTTRKSQHPGSVILDCAGEVGADFIVVPREATTGSAEVLEKAAEYVLLYASQPVLSV